MNLDTGKPPLLAQQIDAAYEQHQEQRFPNRLGASVIGEECERRLYYHFRWGVQEMHEGRTLRIFETGNLEEKRIIQQMKQVGVEFDDDWSQHAFTAANGHVVAKIDGLVTNVPGSPKAQHILEIKTSNQKGFNPLKKNGLAKAKPTHYAQLVLPMHLAEVSRGLYVCKNKNNEELYVERIEPNPKLAEQLLAKAERIITSDRPLARLKDKATEFPCTFCTYSEVCHGDDLPPPTCRSCIHSTPQDHDGEWWCGHHDQPLTYDEQVTGCASHRYLPPLLEHWAEAVESDGDAVLYEHRERRNQTFSNGAAGTQSYTSRELYRTRDKAILSDETVDKLRTEFNGELR